MKLKEILNETVQLDRLLEKIYDLWESGETEAALNIMCTYLYSLMTITPDTVVDVFKDWVEQTDLSTDGVIGGFTEYCDDVEAVKNHYNEHFFNPLCIIDVDLYADASKRQRMHTDVQLPISLVNRIFYEGQDPSLGLVPVTLDEMMSWANERNINFSSIRKKLDKFKTKTYSIVSNCHDEDSWNVLFLFYENA